MPLAAGWLGFGRWLGWRSAPPVAWPGFIGRRTALRCAHICRVGRSGLGIVLERWFAFGLHCPVAIPNDGESVLAGLALVHPGWFVVCQNGGGSAFGGFVSGDFRKWSDRHIAGSHGLVLIFHGFYRWQWCDHFGFGGLVVALAAQCRLPRATRHQLGHECQRFGRFAGPIGALDHVRHHCPCAHQHHVSGGFGARPGDDHLSVGVWRLFAGHSPWTAASGSNRRCAPCHLECQMGNTGPRGGHRITGQWLGNAH